MKLARLLVVAGAAAALVATPALIAQAAPEDGSCRVSIGLPAKGTIHSSSTTFHATLHHGEGCSRNWVGYSLEHPDGAYGGGGSFDKGEYRSAFGLSESGHYRATDIEGSYSYTDATGHARAGHIVGSDSAVMTVKYASIFAWKTPSRSASALTLRASAQRWSPSASAYVRWRGAKVEFQRQVKGGWKTVTSATTDTTGVATVHLRTGRHTWRAVLLPSRSVWGHASHAHIA